MIFSIFATVILSIFSSVGSFKALGDIQLPKFNSFSKIMNGKKFGDKKLCIITGTSSGLGKETAKALINKGDYFVICAVRDLDKMERVAEEENFSSEHYKIMELDLASFSSVRKFANELIELKGDRPLDRLVCNAAVYQPSLPTPKFTEDGIEQQMQINYLSHFLLISLLLPEMSGAFNPRVITVGSVTGNDNTVGGGGVYPVADLREMEGLAEGGRDPVSMMDGRSFNGAKGYKDSKLAVMMIANELHARYHRATGVSFSSIYPGCIAASPLFREKRPWFRKYFPLFMKYITGGYIGEEEAGSRLYQVIVDPRCSKSGVYWSWNGGPREGRGVEALKSGGNIVGAGGAGGGWESIYENDQSDKVHDSEKTDLLWKYSTQMTGAEWAPAKAPISPCPTLRVISFVTNLLDSQEANSLKQKKKGTPRTMGELVGRLSF